MILLIMLYSIIFDKSAEKDLDSLSKETNRKIIRIISKLGIDPKPMGVKKLKASEEDLFRMRSGDYRIIYSIRANQNC